VTAVYKFPIPFLVKERFNELNDVIASKFEEMVAYSTISAKLLHQTVAFRPGQTGSFTIQSTCLVWIHRKATLVPAGVVLSVDEGVLIAEEEATIGVLFPTDFPPDVHIVIDLERAVSRRLSVKIVRQSEPDLEPDSDAPMSPSELSVLGSSPTDLSPFHAEEMSDEV
jgi:hypothetical protein